MAARAGAAPTPTPPRVITLRRASPPRRVNVAVEEKTNHLLAQFLSNHRPERLTVKAAAGAARAAASADWASMRARFVNASMVDGEGGDNSTAVRHWVRFCLHGRRISPARPTEGESGLEEKLREEALLMDFGLWLTVCEPLGNKISVNTAAGYVGTVQAWHDRRFGRKIGMGLELNRLRDMFKGMRRELGQPPRKQRFGVRTQHLAEGLAMLEPSGAESPKQRRDIINIQAALATAFVGLMRGAEFALQDGESWASPSNLSRGDLSFFRDERGALCAALMMRPCKSGRYLHGKHFRLVLAGGGKLVDPVAALWRLVHEDPVPKAQRESTPLFRTHRGGVAEALTVAQVRDTVKQLMREVGEDPAMFGAHSLRIGGATAALTAGVHPSVIRLCGRWNSDLWELYARVSRESAARVTSLIGSTPFHDLERGFHSVELEMLPEEMAVMPEFEEGEIEP